LTRIGPYLILLVFSVSFAGISKDPNVPSSDPPVRAEGIVIGLLLPDHSHNDVINAAEFAIRKANTSGTYGNLKFSLAIRYAEGFWGAGSKESVNLVYEDQVCAIIGALDGRNGHLAEQVAAKSHLSYIETFATEPTLSQAFVPWFKRVVPNDNQQAEILLDQIKRDGGGRICILSQESYDTRFAERSLTRAAARGNGRSPQILSLDTTVFDREVLVRQILDRDPDCLVIPFDASFMGDLLVSLRTARPSMKIYGTLHFAMGAELRGPGWQDYEGVCMVYPRLPGDPPAALADSRSAYLYDAFHLVMQAAYRTGTQRDAISDFISQTPYSGGITGSISFDDLGNRQDACTLIRIQNGKPRYLETP